MHLYYVDLVGVAAQVLLLAILNVLFYLDRRDDALALTALMLVSNATLTWATLRLGPQWYGYGFGLAMSLTAFAGLAVLSRRLHDIEFATFMRERPTPRSISGSAVTDDRRPSPVAAHALARRSPGALAVALGCAALTPPAGASSGIDPARPRSTPDARWALLPTTGADASDRAQRHALIEAHLRARGVRDSLDVRRRHGATRRASAPGAPGYRYAVASDIDVWGYAAGSAPRRASSCASKVVDLETGDVAWSGTAVERGRTGGALAELAERAIGAVVDDIARSRRSWTASRRAGPGVPLRTPPGRATAPRDRHARSRRLAVAAPPRTAPRRPTARPASAPIPGSGPERGSRARRAARSIALHYGDDLPTARARRCSIAWSSSPDHTDAARARRAAARGGADVYAYLSVGEVGPTRAYGDGPVDDGLGARRTNEAWNSRVMDVSAPPAGRSSLAAARRRARRTPATPGCSSTRSTATGCSPTRPMPRARCRRPRSSSFSGRHRVRATRGCR